MHDASINAFGSEMSVIVHIPYIFHHLTGGIKTIRTKSQNTGGCLHELVERFPSIKSRLFDEQGQLKKYVELYMNNNKIDNRLDFPMRDEDELRIYVVILGG